MHYTLSEYRRAYPGFRLFVQVLQEYKREVTKLEESEHPDAKVSAVQCHFPLQPVIIHIVFKYVNGIIAAARLRIQNRRTR